MSATDVSDFQKFLDIGVELGVVKDKVDGRALTKAFN
jgi:NitT/TauT family transport system substrate-binding protein